MQTISTKKTPVHNETILVNGFTVKPQELECIVTKEWGHEEWIVNNHAYCGKKLVFKAEYQCSMHHHKIKTETFYVQSGKVVLETEDESGSCMRIMEQGDVAHITPGTWHRLTALTPAEVIEFSTFHMEEDSYRKTSSGKANFTAMGLENL